MIIRAGASRPQRGIIKGQKVMASREMMRAVDAQNGRLRMYSDERQALEKICAAFQLICEYYKKMQRIGRETKAYKKFRASRDLLDSAIGDYTSKCKLEQVQSIQNTVHNKKIIVQSYSVPQMVNIRQDDLRQAMYDVQDHHCRNCMECMNRAEYSKCKWARLFDLQDCIMTQLKGHDDHICRYKLASNEEWEL